MLLSPTAPGRAAPRVDQRAAAGLSLVVLALAVGFAPLPAAALAAVGFIAVAAWEPVPALAIVVLSVPFSPLERPVGRFDFSPMEIFIVLATFAYFVRSGFILGLPGRSNVIDPIPVTGRRPSSPVPGADVWSRRLGPGGDRVLLGLVGLVVLTAVASLGASAEVHQSLQSLRVVIVEPALFYLLVVSQTRWRRDLALLALALVVAGVAISMVGGWQYLTNERIITAEAGLRRIRGFYGSPNNLGLFLGRALPMGCALALFWERGRLWLVIASVVMAGALVLTFSLGAWFAVAPSLLLVAALRGRSTLRGAAALTVVGIIGLGVAALRIPRIGSHFDVGSLSDASTSVIRLNVWDSALRMIADHPIRGIGLDNFLYYYQHGYMLPTAWREPDLSHPHNLILDFWLSLGLPGLILLGALLARFVELVWSRWRISDSFERGLYAGAAGAVADTVLHGMVDNSFFLPDLAVLFWLVFGIVSLLSRPSGKLKRS